MMRFVNIVGKPGTGIYSIELHRILTPANPESSHFLEIHPSPAPDKCLADLADASAAAVC